MPIIKTLGNALTSYKIFDGMSSRVLTSLTASKIYDISYSVDRSVPNTAADNFNLNAAGRTYFSSVTYSTVVQSDGKILVGGGFINYAGQYNRNYLIRLNSDGTEDTVFTNNATYNVATGAAKFDSGAVRAIAIQSDGKILVGGGWVNYNGTSGKSYLVRLNSDGTEDTSFNSNMINKFFAQVLSIAVQSDGKILVGGTFTAYNSQTGKNYLIRLNADGTEDTSFSTNAVVNGTTARFSLTVQNIKIQSDGKILVGGNFVVYSGQTGKNYLIRLNSDGTEDTAFSANAVVSGTTNKLNGIVYSITIQPDGKILVGGAFTNYNAQTGKDKLIRINSDGTEDTAFNANAVVNGTTARFNNTVYSTAIQANSNILVGGFFTNYSSQTNKSRLISLNSDGTEDTTFNTKATISGSASKFNTYSTNNVVYSITIIPNNKIFINGGFRYATGSVNIACIDFSGNFIDLFGTSPLDLSFFNSIAIQPDGKILAGGGFTNYRGQIGRNFLIRLNSDGTEDTAFTNNAVYNSSTGSSKFNVSISVVTVQPDGKILVGGGFTNYNGQTYKNFLIRLNSDGTEDTAFSTNAIINTSTGTAKFSDQINSIVIQSDGKILVGGVFSNYNGQTNRSCLIRLNGDGTEDTTFTNNAVYNSSTLAAKFNGAIYAVALQSDGKILVGGWFTAYNAQTNRASLIRLNSDGTEDTAFTNNAVYNTGTAAAKFNYYNNIITVQSDGKILVGGAFTNYNAQTGKNYLIRLNSDGTEDTAFNANAVVSGTTAKFNTNINAIMAQPDGKVLVSGQFTNYGTTPTGKNYLIRFNSDGTEDTAFTSNMILANGISKFDNIIYTAAYLNGSIYINGYFKNYTSAISSVPATTFLRIDSCIRKEVGSIQAVYLNTGLFSYSTRTTLSDSAYSTGVTVNFGTDGLITYNSTTLNSPSSAVDTIKLRIREL